MDSQGNCARRGTTIGVVDVVGQGMILCISFLVRTIVSAGLSLICFGAVVLAILFWILTLPKSGYLRLRKLARGNTTTSVVRDIGRS